MYRSTHRTLIVLPRVRGQSREPGSRGVGIRIVGGVSGRVGTVARLSLQVDRAEETVIHLDSEGCGMAVPRPVARLSALASAGEPSERRSGLKAAPSGSPDGQPEPCRMRF